MGLLRDAMGSLRQPGWDREPRAGLFTLPALYSLKNMEKTKRRAPKPGTGLVDIQMLPSGYFCLHEPRVLILCHRPLAFLIAGCTAPSVRATILAAAGSAPRVLDSSPSCWAQALSTAQHHSDAAAVPLRTTPCPDDFLRLWARLRLPGQRVHRCHVYMQFVLHTRYTEQRV